MPTSGNVLAMPVPLFTLHWIAVSGFPASVKSLSGKVLTLFRYDSPLLKEIGEKQLRSVTEIASK